MYSPCQAAVHVVRAPDLDEMALPPCHMFCQFYVSNGELSCQVGQLLHVACFRRFLTR